MLVLACTIYMGHRLGLGQSASICAMLLQEKFEKCFLPSLSSENKKRIGCSVSQTVVRRSPVWQARRGSNLGPAPPWTTLFTERQQWVFQRISAIFLGVFSKHHKFAEGVGEALMGGVEGSQRPNLRAKEPEKTGELTDGQNPQVKKH
jgi:hypothetical protein